MKITHACAELRPNMVARRFCGSALVAAYAAVAMTACGDSSSLGGGIGGVGNGPPGSEGSLTPSFDHIKSATVSPPIGTAGLKLQHPVIGVGFDLAPFGFVEEEFFVTGTATTLDGTSPMPYTTRIIVRRPKSAEAFNGTVLQEWFNVSLQHDVDVDWISHVNELLHGGYAYVGVSAQPPPQPLTTFDPVRYSAMNHPGDDYAEDIFTQVAKTLKVTGTVNPLGPLNAKRVIATGMSQSADRLHNYIKIPDLAARIFDGFLIDRGVAETGTIPFEANARVPTIFTLGEFESASDQMNHNDKVRVWQIAGASHVENWLDSYDVHNQVRDESGMDSGPWDPIYNGRWGEDGDGMGTCGLLQDAGGANMFPRRYVHDLALHLMNEWIQGGAAAPEIPFLQFHPGMNVGVVIDMSPDLVTRDANGNALGGFRLPQIDVPVASYQGENCAGTGLTGSTMSFPDAQLFQLYPTFADYREKMRASSADLMRRGLLMPYDCVDIAERVQRVKTRWPTNQQGDAGTSAFKCT